VLGTARRLPTKIHGDQFDVPGKARPMAQASPPPGHGEDEAEQGDEDQHKAVDPGQPVSEQGRVP